MTHETRRIEDTGLGKIIYFWPIVGGLFLSIMALGGYIATLHQMSDQIQNIQKDRADQISVNSRLVTLEEVTERRLKSIEDWRDGVKGVYGNRRGD